ncbi:MAG TPA: Uma2 family endonuclease [Candidatus Elarobacter sp.]|nr:Uma2 family endonuclease [Candidatus Elarobacter sp.]
MDTPRPSSGNEDLLYSKGDMEAAIVQHDITVEEFDLMVESGAFAEQHVELIDGRLIDMPPQGPPHDGTLTAFLTLFQRGFGRRVLVRIQMCLPVARTSEPVPDLALVRWEDGFYRDRHPRAEETFAVVEVSFSSLTFDRNVKRRLYGAARIPEYWIVDVTQHRIVVNREPNDLGYASEEIRERGDSVSFEAFPDVVFSVTELVG